MNGFASALAVLAAILAVADWWAVATGHRRVRVVTKPGTMAALVGVALAGTPFDDPVRAWVVAGLALSLVGDVLLLLSERWFVGGLAAFLLAHVAYIVGFGLAPASAGWAVLGAAVVLSGGATLGRRVVAAAASVGGTGLAGPVVAYLVVISAMVVRAAGTAAPAAVAGALLFYASDATLAWNRFVAPHRRGPLAVMVTYHLGQAGLVAWLFTG